MQFSLSDLGTVADVARQVDANPLTLVGRFAGFSGDEQRAGVPTWAWILVAGGACFWLGAKYGPSLSKRLPWT